MKLLHGSYMDIVKPDLTHCKSNNDFGRGFYLTPNWKRAWQMAKRSSMIHHGKITVNAFLFYPKKCEECGFRIKKFDGFTPDWARFIINNRENTNFVHEYDIVIGPVADAIIDQEIVAYKREYGKAYLEEENLEVFASHVSQFGHDYIQYCFCTQRAIDELIKD